MKNVTLQTFGRNHLGLKTQLSNKTRITLLRRTKNAVADDIMIMT